jgi:hypothetical protein
VDGASLVNAWLYFPCLKVGQIHLYSFSPFIINRCGVRNTIITGPCSWLKLFSLAVFLSQGLLNSSRVLLQIRPVFVPRNFVCLNNQIQKYLIDTLEAKCNLDNFSHQEGLAAFTPALPELLNRLHFTDVVGRVIYTAS